MAIHIERTLPQGVCTFIKFLIESLYIMIITLKMHEVKLLYVYLSFVKNIKLYLSFKTLYKEFVIVQIFELNGWLMQVIWLDSV